ncbi:DUF6491 family protein [Dyella sedimenti]|uniref:DUF6491 family protein n=1 Tax=Dyella sedimenti TaxID=2919947 RepID=UPI001FAB0099|nr:DUF6491 family protein [Dyella sedimenti]
MKSMTALLLAVLLPAAASPGLAATPPRPPAYTPLRPVSECLRPDRINEWHVVDPHTVIARTGPNRYLVKLRTRCPRLGIGQSLRFQANPSNRTVGMGALCGEAGETVASRDQAPCPVQSVAKIDKARFDRLSAKATRHGTQP